MTSLLARASFGVLAAAALASSAHAANRNCRQAERDDGDHWAFLNSRDTGLAIQRHLPWGQPVATSPVENERLVVLTEYVNAYDEDLLIPLWSAERLQGRGLNRVPDRINCFRRHPKVSSSDLSRDYDDPIFDQGHLTGSEDQSASVRAMVNTFFYTNMTPQFARFNQVTWNRLETVVRQWAVAKGQVYVVTGAILDRDHDRLRDADSAAERVQPRHGRPARVAIPTEFYKIVAYQNPSGEIHTLSVVLPHNADRLTGRDLGRLFEEQVTTIADVERRTGLDFFPQATSLVEENDFCSFAGGAPASLCGP